MTEVLRSSDDEPIDDHLEVENREQNPIAIDPAHLAKTRLLAAQRARSKKGPNRFGSGSALGRDC